MRLLVDLGNTRIKWVVENQPRDFVQRGSHQKTQMLDRHSIFDQVHEVHLSSVADDELTHLHRHALVRLGCEVNEVKVQTARGALTNNYREIDRLGVDRWVAAVGAQALYPDNTVIVIDAGTAITVDVVANGQFRGGLILPGLGLMHRMLNSNTAGIFAARYADPPLIGRDTEQCVNSGVENTVIGGVERIVSRLLNDQTTSDPNCSILVCGGDAKWLKTKLNVETTLNLDLIFIGLSVIADQHEKREK